MGFVAGYTCLEPCDCVSALFNISCAQYKRLLVEKEDVSTASVLKSFSVIPQFLLLYDFRSISYVHTKV